MTGAPLRRLGAAALLLLPAAAGALQVELRDSQTNAAVAEITFGELLRNGNHNTAGQYLYVRYPFSTHREVRIYTDNGRLVDGAPQGGLASFESRQEELPLFWTDTPLSGVGSTVFTPATQGDWKRFVDVQDPAFGDPSRRRITSQPSGESAVHFGMLMSPTVPAGQYLARVVVQEVSDVEDIRPPVILHVPFQALLNDGRPATFRAVIQDDVQVVSATLHYRREGQSDFQTAEMTLQPDPANPFRWIARATLALTADELGGLTYFFTASDGVNDSTFAGVAASFQASLLPMDTPICQALSPAGGQLDVFVGDPDMGPSQLNFRPRSLAAPRTICARYVDPRAAPQWKGQSPVAVFEFSPSGLRFDTPVDLTLVYADADQDGRVDGDGREETALRVFLLEDGVWRHVGGKADIAANRVTAPVRHFSSYGLFAAPSLTPDMVRPAEKLFSPNGDGVNDFLQFNATGDVRIKILDVRGKRVRELSGTNFWDGRGSDGELAETGVYVYEVETGGLTVTGTVGVVR